MIAYILHLRNSRVQREKGREGQRKKKREDKSLRANILSMRKEKYDRRFKSLCLNINPHYYIPAKNRRIKRN